MSNLGLWGKTHVLLPCGFLPLLFVTLLSHPPLSTSLMHQLVVGGVIAEVVVVVAGCQPYPLAHSTHIFPFFSLTHSSLASSLSPRFWVCWLPHAQALGDFGLTQAFYSSPRVAKRSGTCNSRPPDCYAFSRREFPSRFSFSSTGISWVLPMSFSSVDW